jgi:hypothetical protein
MTGDKEMARLLKILTGQEEMDLLLQALLCHESTRE